MMITHVLKDGKVVRDIQGHVVKMKEAKGFYALMDSINNKANRGKNGSTSKNPEKP